MLNLFIRTETGTLTSIETVIVKSEYVPLKNSNNDRFNSLWIYTKGP